jgi:hypothetical protein
MHVFLLILSPRQQSISKDQTYTASIALKLNLAQVANKHKQKIKKI